MIKKTEQIQIVTEYITLGQFLKLINVAKSGGEAKSLLETLKINVNNLPENRRGRKLRDGDKVEIGDTKFVIKR